MRQFYLHARKGIFYVQFVNQETKKCLPARSTGKGNRDEALIVVAGWLKDGIPERRFAPASKPSRPVAEKLSVAQVLSELKNAELDFQDIPKIEKILREKGLITFIEFDSIKK
ncbi:hypothetical protein FACS1894163_04110 [Spirochaetia bacterium]|nr:hypothetical protein FACS1894163_04110 [Spirochaetia bacterium]